MAVVAILAAILNCESCPRVRNPHPPGNVNWDPIDRKTARKKLSKKAGFTLLAPRLFSHHESSLTV